MTYYRSLYSLKQARTEAKLLLSAILAVPAWRGSLDLECEEAFSTTSIIFKEEAASLDRTASSATIAEVSLSELSSAELS